MKTTKNNVWGLYLVLSIIATASISFTSCSKDDPEPEPQPQASSEIPATAGMLSSGTDADKNLPEGYRIISVGGTEYGYDANGKLIDIDGITVQNGTLSYSFEDEYGYYKYVSSLTFDSNGLLIAENAKEEGTQEGEKWTVETQISCTYNANKQISTISSRYIWKDGEQSTERGQSTATFTYDNMKLDQITYSEEGEEDGDISKESGTYKFIYGNSLTTIFFQYTPRLADLLDDVTMELSYIKDYAYLGLMGRASSMLPTSITSERKGSGEETSTYQCGPYEFNAYGALRSADNETYTYSIGDNANTPAMKVASKKSNLHKRISTLHRRFHKK